jgi:hypothetical protein
VSGGPFPRGLAGMKKAQTFWGRVPLISMVFSAEALPTMIVFVWLILLWVSFRIWPGRKQHPYQPAWACRPNWAHR